MGDTVVCGDKPKVRNRKHLTPSEVAMLVTAAGKAGRYGERDQTLILVIYRHGLRVGEVVDLRWSDLDLDAPRDRTLTVRRIKGSADSTHTLEPDTTRALKKLKAKSDSLYVFTTERGGPMSVDAVQVIVARAGELAGLPFKATPHMLRHACGFYLANIGTDTRLIQGYLGHRDIRNTVIYTDLSQKRLASVRVR